MVRTIPANGVTLEQLRRRREDILRVAAAHGASNVRVFGSVARGNTDTSSDIDILVDINADVSGFAYFGVLEGLRRDLESLLRRKVDVVELRGPFSSVGKGWRKRSAERPSPCE